ncbi:MAG: tRNA (guanosine(37)-N1)-methyltransferase TrmD [Alphaproteobacteria bacterium]
MRFKFTILTLFPEMFPAGLEYSLAGKGYERQIWDFDCIQIRDYAEDKHKKVDDTPAGGGAGLVMRADVLGKATEAALNKGAKTPLIYFTPRGKPLTQADVRQIAQGEGATLLCGRFEGVDQRLLEEYDYQEVCIGDYILSGGEPAALVLMDAVIRLLEGVTGSETSLEDESFENGLLEYPQYTRPALWKGRGIPEVLTSGDHQKVDKWRKTQSAAITKERRPDLWQAFNED